MNIQHFEEAISDARQHPDCFREVFMRHLASLAPDEVGRGLRYQAETAEITALVHGVIAYDLIAQRAPGVALLSEMAHDPFLEKNWRDQAIVLLSRTPEGQDILLREFVEGAQAPGDSADNLDAPPLQPAIEDRLEPWNPPGPP